MAGARSAQARPILAVSAAIIRGDDVLIVRRAHPSANGLYTLPGGRVEWGEPLTDALIREVAEETGLSIAPVALAGYREVLDRDPQGRVERHFVILAFAARLTGGELRLNEELSEAHWLNPAALDGLETTEGLAEIVAAAFARSAEAGSTATPKPQP